MDDIDPFAPQQIPTARRPLLGLTVLVVEDSRFASEALRLMCLRSGARIRRADCLTAARRHLKVYRPSVAVVDLGLPDGSGLELIADLHAAQPRVGAILATSGDDSQKICTLEAGADAFLLKPLGHLAEFQQAILSHLPENHGPALPRPLPDEAVTPDPQTYLDDMGHVMALLDEGDARITVDYIAQFLSSVARSAEDAPLDAAAQNLMKARRKGESLRAPLALLGGLVQDRMARQLAI